MKKIFLLSILLAPFLFSAAQLNKEQTGIRKVFFDFLGFYGKNEKKFHSFKLHKGTGKENNPPFHIQWKEVDRYFAFLRKSVTYVGETYIKTERNYFLYYDSCFKADPTEELPVGFDFDRWGGGQETIAYLYKWHTNPKNKYIVTITGNTAVLKIGQKLWKEAKEADLSWSFVPFVKEKGKWVMADNVYPL